MSTSRRALWKPACLCPTSLLLAACSTVGPLSIDQGRTSYNEVIQSTSEQQTLLNLVRVHDGETPLFMDVTEVDAASTAQVGVSGTESGLGSILNRASTAGTLASSVGSFVGSAQYQEAPTVRYQPLLGAALVAQVSTPVNAESIVNLYNSGWPLGSIFDMTVARFTPGFDDYHAALDALMVLDRYGALILEAKTPERPMPSALNDARVDVMVGQPASMKGDADLLIHFRRGRPRSRFRACDGPVEGELHPPKETDGQRHDRQRREEKEAKTAVDNLWARVLGIFGQKTGDTVTLDVKTGPRRDKTILGSASPMLQTRSALGMLNAIATGDNLVAFSDKEDVDRIYGRAVDSKGYCHASFYGVAGDDAGEPNNDNRRFSLYDGTVKASLTSDELDRERDAADERRLILIERTEARPADAFVSVFHKGKWYSIQDRDLISKRNLALVAQIDTIQAVPPQGAPLTPTINVGAR